MAGETRISDLIKDIRQGELILHEFQRGYVWDRDWWEAASVPAHTGPNAKRRWPRCQAVQCGQR
jgi:hypothetical protein